MNFPLLSTLADRIRRQGVVQVMRHRDFARYVSTSWAAMIGLWAQRLAIGWMTWELTHSPAWLGAIALGNALPAVVLVPFAGAIADRVDRLWLLKFAQGFQFLVSAALALSTLAGLMDIWLLLSLSIAVGLLETLATPSRMTIGPGLVPREDLSGAIALTAVAFNSATFIGPAIAGLVISKWGIGYAFVLACIGLTPHFLILYAIRLRATEHVAGRGQSLLGDVMEALRYLAGHQSLAPILMLAIVSSFSVRHLPDLMPGFAGDVFQGGAQSLGILMSAFGAGGMLGSLWVANRNRVTGTTRIFFFGLMGNGFFVFIFAASGNFYVGLVALLCFGLTMSTSGNSAQILLQNAVDGAMRARVMSLYSLTFRGGPSIGAMLFGALSTYFGLQIPVAAGALICLIAALWFQSKRTAIAGILESDGQS